MTKLTTVLITVALAFPAMAEPIDRDDVRVIDGDTIKVYRVELNVRLIGFNAPETRRARCETGRELGAKAGRRLRDIIRADNLDFKYVLCSCLPGTQGTTSCNWARDCGTLKSNGRDVGNILIAEGLAVPFVCGPTWCPEDTESVVLWTSAASQRVKTQHQ